MIEDKNDPEPAPFNDEQMDIIAGALAQSSIALRNEMQAAIDKAVTELRAEKNLHEAVAEAPTSERHRLDPLPTLSICRCSMVRLSVTA